VDRLPLGAAADAVGDPDITLEVDRQAVREHEHPGAELLHQFAGGIELQDRIEIRTVAVEDLALAHLRRRDETLRAAALRDPDAAAVTVDADAGGRAPDAAFRHLAPALDGAIGIWR
jgi:hypothetical protein